MPVPTQPPEPSTEQIAVVRLTLEGESALRAAAEHERLIASLGDQLKVDRSDIEIRAIDRKKGATQVRLALPRSAGAALAEGVAKGDQTLASVADTRLVRARVLSWGRWGDIVRLFFWMRVGLLGGLFLFAAPFVTAWPSSPLFGNMFVVDSPAAVAFIAAVSIFAAWTCGCSISLVRLYAEERMRDGRERKPPTHERAPLRLVAYSVFAAPIIGAVLLRSELGLRGILAAVLGAGAPILVGIVFSAWLWRKGLEQYSSTKESCIARWLARFGPWLRSGYTRRNHAGVWIILPGHVVALGLLCLLGLGYGLLGFFFKPGVFHVMTPPPLVFILVLFMMNVAILAALSFFLDRFRVPLLVVVITLNMLSLTFNAPHTYLVYPYGSSPTTEPGEQSGSLNPNLAPPELPESWTPLLGRPTDAPYTDTIVVVCASGGGIHAAAWTARILTWLNEDLGNEFTRATRLYSGVSGGSVGLMYFLDSFNLGALPEPDSAASVRGSADEGSLSQVAWGLAYPDFCRAWLPFCASKVYSRAWALELAWRGHPGPDGHAVLRTQWSDWVRNAQDGHFPGVVFNAFDITRGYRLLLGNVQIPGASGARPITALRADWTPDAPTDPTGPGPNTLAIDIDVVTAARLSATFPYVSPISTARIDTDRKDAAGIPVTNGTPLATWAVADGGYFDNAGIMTGVEWIRSVAAAAKERGVKHVIVLEIRAFSRPTGGGSSTPMDHWRFSVLGPVLGMLKTRESSQMARNDLDIALLKDELKDSLEIEHVVFEPPPDGNWPLSWQLSAAEIRELDAIRDNHTDSYLRPLHQIQRTLHLPETSPPR